MSRARLDIVMVAETLGLLCDVAPGGGYCVGSSNSVPEYVPAANYRAMIETVHKYGRYPICIEGRELGLSR